jgi:hypothetical protein
MMHVCQAASGKNSTALSVHPKTCEMINRTPFKSSYVAGLELQLPLVAGRCEGVDALR